MKRPCSRFAFCAAALTVAALASGGCRDTLRFDPAAVAAHPMLQGAPRGFLLGAASSAYQIEGGNRNDWTDWEKGRYSDGTPHVADGLTADRLDDSWNRWPQDVEALRLLGANVYRLGIEWSRLEPAEGTWDQAAADRYRAMFAALRAAHIAPMVTLYHFTLPTWIAARGGWEWAGTPAALAAFAGRAGAAFGDLVDWWCTINEPNVLVAKSYLAGQWPPGVRDPARGARVMAALMRAHGSMAVALRASDRSDADGDGRATQIGIAQNLRIFDPASASPLDGLAAGIADGFYDESFLDAVTLGRVRVVLPGVADIDEPFPALAGSFDYLGINYYTRDRIEGRLSGTPPYRARPTDDRPHSDLGWEIYPEGLYRLLVRYAHRGWPLLVTENGVADQTGTLGGFLEPPATTPLGKAQLRQRDASGGTRPEFLRAHLYAVDRALAEGVDVRGYIFWSLTDNFEWSHGARGRFGLFSVDFSDPALARRPTSAVATFQEAARNLGSN